MTNDLSPVERAKFAAAKWSVDYVENGMRVGLGTGSTAAWMVQCLGERVQNEGLKIKAVPTSSRTAAQARDLGIEVVDLDNARWLDLTIDGADEFDGEFSLIKGGGGALLQEKIVATASDRMIVIADPAKSVAALGNFPLPVEVTPFAASTTQAVIEEMLISVDVLNRETAFRQDGDALYVTDEGNHILDLHLKRIGNPRQLALLLNQVPGVVENGLFVDICDTVVMGFEDGSVKVRDIDGGAGGDAWVEFAEAENMFAEITR